MLICPHPLAVLEQTIQGLLSNGDILYMANHYFRFIHREASCHKYAVSWTTARSPELGKSGGGHFFICTHGIKVEAAADTVIIWRPKKWHGTSLQNRDPRDPEIFQAGLAIVTPPIVASLWAKVVAEQLTIEEARRKVMELESEGDDI